MKLDKFGYAALDPDLMMEFLLFCLELHSWTDYIRWNQSRISLKQMMGTMIEKQGNRTLIPKLAQTIPVVEHEIYVKDRDDHTENVIAFKVEEDDWNFRLDRRESRKGTFSWAS